MDIIKTTNNILYETIKKRDVNSHKGSFGRVLLIGGNKLMAGAILMASQAALYSGAGLITVATDKDNFTALHARHPEIMVADYNDFDNLANLLSQATVIVLGPGLGTDDFALKLVNFVLKNRNLDVPLILDASALTIIASHNLTIPKNCILTPHQKEWERISNIQIADQSVENTVEYLSNLDNRPILVLKKHHSQIFGNNTIYKLTNGGPHQAIGGMGDTLTGIIAAFVAQFSKKNNDLALDKITASACFLHSYAADLIAERNYISIPSELCKVIPGIMKNFAS